MEVSKPYYSEKFKLISMICMIAVVFIHSYNYTDTFLQTQTLITEGLHFGACLEFLFSNALTRFAVPMFFAMSGFFFFKGKNFNKQTYFIQIKKRIKSILLVFIIFSIISFFICALIYLIIGEGIIPMIDERMVYVLKGGFGFLYPLLQNPFAFQLWFLAQLFIMAIFSPIVYLLVKKLKWIPIVILAGLWLFDLNLNIFTYTLFNCDAYLFFTLGAYIAINDIHVPGLNNSINNKSIKIFTLIFWIAISIFYTILAATLKDKTIIQTFIYKVICILGIINIWLIFDNIKPCENKVINTLKENNFSVYLYHEPLLHIIFMTVTAYYKSDVIRMVLYFILPCIIILACAYFGKFLRKKAPKLNRLITGGR